VVHRGLERVTHGAVMLFLAVAHPVHAGHLAGDVWTLGGAIGLALPLHRAPRHTAARPVPT
jgi:hypothetical protein